MVVLKKRVMDVAFSKNGNKRGLLHYTSRIGDKTIVHGWLVG